MKRVPPMLLIALLLAAACGERRLPPPDVVARIGGEELPYADFEAYLRVNSLDTETGLNSEVLSGLFDQYLDEALLGKLAVDEGLAVESDPRNQAVEALISDALPSELPGEEIARYFADHRTRFERQEEVVLRQILVSERGDAEAAREAIAAGMSFEDAAREYSQGPGAALGGMQGALSREDLPPAFADLIFALEIGEVSEIVAADYGLHLFQVIERRPAEQPDLETARPAIVEQLRQRARAEVVAALVERARRSYNTAVYARNLPFNYTGIRK